jgi:hypothetical protein
MMYMLWQSVVQYAESHRTSLEVILGDHYEYYYCSFDASDSDMAWGSVEEALNNQQAIYLHIDEYLRRCAVPVPTMEGGE